MQIKQVVSQSSPENEISISSSLTTMTSTIYTPPPRIQNGARNNICVQISTHPPHEHKIKTETTYPGQRMLQHAKLVNIQRI